jgi:hypothetical protein
MNQTSQDPINFKLFSNGVVFTFDNGYAVSIRWGENNYADRINCVNSTASECAMTAEVAVFDSTVSGMLGLFVFVQVDGYDYHGDDVLGRLNINQVLDILNKVAAMPAVRTLPPPKEEGNGVARVLDCYKEDGK